MNQNTKRKLRDIVAIGSLSLAGLSIASAPSIIDYIDQRNSQGLIEKERTEMLCEIYKENPSQFENQYELGLYLPCMRR